MMITRLDVKSAPWLCAPETKDVLAALESAPDMVRFVGGCVRNTLMGQRVSDIDLATRHGPDDVIRLIEAAGLKAIPTGLAHGTITAVARGKPFEITTLRADVETDGRRAVVAFTQDWAQDAKRRDFTMNAIYADADGRLFDPVGGIADALAGHVRFIGDAGARISEDYLRILRFFRFLAQYGGTPDAPGLAACAQEKAGLAQLSGERILAELTKLVAAPHAVSVLKQMQAGGILDEVLPGPHNFVCLEALIKIEMILGREVDPTLHLGALLQQDAAIIKTLNARFKFSNEMRVRLLALARESKILMPLSEREVRAQVYRLGKSTFIDQLLMSWADQGGDKKWIASLRQAEKWSVPVMPVKGEDIVAAGIEPGPEVGAIMKKLEAHWVDQDFQLDRTVLLGILRKQI